MTMDDRKIDIAIGKVLRVGVLLAVSVVLTGGIWYLAAHGLSIPDYHSFTGAPANLRSVGGIAGGAIHGDSRALIQFGLLLLVATPIARVAFSAVAFAMERDQLYVVVTLIVLAVLVGSLLDVGAGASG